VAERYQVIVVGGGPVGVALAVDLGLRGISVALVETRIGLSAIPKGQNLTQRTMEHFQFWGVVDQIRAARTAPEGYPIGEVTFYRSLSSEYWHAPPGREMVRALYSQANERLPQYQTEKVLRAKMDTLPNVARFFGWTAKSVEQDDSGVRIAIEQADGGGCQILEADYAVGCDGPRSLVRDQIGIERAGTDFDQLMVLLVFRSRDLHEALKKYPPRSTYRVMHPDLNGYWQFFGRIDVGEGWFFHSPVPADSNRENFDFHGLVEKVAGFKMQCEYDHVGFWDLRVSVAKRYRVGRVFIAGDAAHSHPPYGGFGLNHGLEDVANLGWKLAARLKGWGGDRLLSSYGEERRPVFEETAEDFIAARIKREGELLNRATPETNKAEFEAIWRQFGTDIGWRVQNYEPNYEGSSVVMGPPGAVCSAHGDHLVVARVGHHLTPLPLSKGGNTFDELGPDFTLLAIGADGLSIGAIERAAAQLGVPLKTVEDSWSGGREAYEARLILVRPDQYVVWTGDKAPDDPVAMMRRVTGRE
jgi:2-polyprenyl-6-methoxyphenol hydroxylase-like FAD-dependent oxidoreductase